MNLRDSLEQLGDHWNFDSLAMLRSEVGIGWVQDALKATGKMSIRRRLLPSEAVVWLVIGMALYRNMAIEAVFKHLGIVARRLRRRRQPTGSPVGSDTVARARQRVGSAPLLRLASMCALAWQREFAANWVWHGLNVFAIDGTTLRIAGTAENELAYGRPGSAGSPAAYPQARVLALVSVGTRIMLDFVVGMLSQTEHELAVLLWPKLPPKSLVLLDRGFVNHAAFARISAMGEGRQWLCRAKSNMKVKVLHVLGRGDALVEIALSSRARKLDPTLPKRLTVRMIEYRLGGRDTYRILTSLVDSTAYSAQELIVLCHERWEVEIAFAEEKALLLERKETIRSKKADGVLQEIAGIVIAYNLIRVQMARAAILAGVPPRQMSFKNSMTHIRNFLLSAVHVAPGALPKLYRRLCEDLAQLVLPERRERSCPREVKIRPNKYRLKKIRTRSLFAESTNSD